MCGRFVQKGTWEELMSFFDIKGPPLNFAARYNVAPTQDVAVIVPATDSRAADGRHIEIKKWGLIPAWSKDGKASFSTFNARAESVREKPAFRGAFEKRRCIVPADGFYEWTGAKGDKVPHFFTRRDGAPLALAGLHESWTATDKAETVQSFTIVVTGANCWMSAFHDRMPVIVAKDDIDTWLNGTPDAAAALMQAAPEETLSERVVSKLVNSVKNEGPGLLAPDAATPEPKTEPKTGPAGDLFAL